MRCQHNHHRPKVTRLSERRGWRATCGDCLWHSPVDIFGHVPRWRDALIFALAHSEELKS